MPTDLTAGGDNPRHCHQQDIIPSGLAQRVVFQPQVVSAALIPALSGTTALWRTERAFGPHGAARAACSDGS